MPARDDHQNKSRKGPDQAEIAYKELYELLYDRHPAEPRRSYLKARWLNTVQESQRRMRRSRNRFRWANLMLLGATGALPVVVTASTQAEGTWRTVLGVASVALSLVAVAGTAVLQALQPGPRWRLEKKLGQSLVAEGWTLATTASASDAKSAAISDAEWSTFVTKVESGIQAYDASYIERVAGTIGGSTA